MLNGSPPFTFQVALQGGGAKLVALLAAMAAVQRLERDGLIRVSRIAGTSAGAIAAALYAADADMPKALDAFRKDLAGGLLVHFPTPTRLKIAWRLIRLGRPLWKQDHIARTLHRYFKGTGIHTFGDLVSKGRPHLHIMAANLATGAKHVYRSSDSRDVPVVNALLDSCAIPFCLRTWDRSQNPVIVDGGICENLPADELLAHEALDGPVVAFSFEPTPRSTPQSFVEFALALLDTAMNNSISRAKDRLGHERVLQIRTSLDTFDFKQASLFSNEDAQAIGSATVKFIDRLRTAPELGTPVSLGEGDPWATLNVPTMENAWKAFQSRRTAYGDDTAYEECCLVVVAYSLLDDVLDVNHGKPDVVSCRIRFRPTGRLESTSCVVTPPEDARPYLPPRFRVTRDTLDGAPIAFVVTPARDPAQPQKRVCVITFTPPLEPDQTRYYFSFTEFFPGFMSDLAINRRDELFFSTVGNTSTVDAVKIVLHVPLKNAKAAMMPDQRSQGRAMTPSELEPFPAPKGFVTLGWIGHNIAPGRFGAGIVL
jgi:predicted acylesterase/phospholipase RssA